MSAIGKKRLSVQKVLLLTVDFFPKLGGISISVHHLANALSDQGLDVVVLVPGAVAIPDGLVARYKLCVDTHARADLAEGVVWERQEAPRTVRFLNALQEIEGFDRAIAMHFQYYGQAITLETCRLSPISSVFVHGQEVKSRLTTTAWLRSLRSSYFGQQPTIRQELLRVLGHSSQIISNSAYTATMVRRVRPADDVLVAGCGVSDQAIKSDGARLRSDRVEKLKQSKMQLGFGPDDKIIGTVSRIVKHKNIDKIILAMKHLEDHKLLIVGDGPEKQNLIELASNKGLSDRVYWFGSASFREKWQCINAMDIFCLMSSETQHGHVEGFGIVLVEAACCRVPIIANRSGGIVDFVLNGETGRLVRRPSARAIARSVREHWQSPETTQHMVDLARQMVETKYNWPAISRRMVAAWSAS